MTILNIEVLKQLVENVPEDFTVEYQNDVTVVPITDKVEIDISGKCLIFRS